ncbi:polyphosphate kinase 1 [Steroidobacter denitrificans]|uniref:polyphosphate kinase 1 n=1 Tax=Steroidobacter denitrificans TaxID=465721 RepID=UPI000B1C9B41|nr:polyphosphate kinase 1 [Steroidobacter denitrificans]
MNLKAPEYYINRELSFLDFNCRVLAQAHDESLPLLERIRFLGISCSNLDEFFEIRVAGLKQRLELGSLGGGPDGMSVPEQLAAIHQRAQALVEDQYQLLHQLVFPTLAAENIVFVNARTLSNRQRAWLADYFAHEVEPVLTPLGLDPARPFPRIQNKSLNFIVRLAGKDAFGRDAGLTVVQVPRSLPRIIRLPHDEDIPGKTCFVFLSATISAFLDQLFGGMVLEGAWQFRVTRNSELFVDDDDEEVDNLLRAIEGELAQRRYGAAVRLETSLDCPENISNFLLRHFALGRDDLYQVNGPVNLNRLTAIYDLVDRPDLKYPEFTPGMPRHLRVREDIFAVLRDGDLLLHHPFESFAPVIDFLRQAALDPDVLAIKQTLYRAGPQSPVVDALVDAARAGKEVTVIIELMARFDEAANIQLATRLQEAGAHVMYGVVGYKTHAKLIMVVRREGGKLRRYCHCGTGNYHPETARVYTDYGLFTCDEIMGEDLHELLLQLTSPTRVAALKKILQSPFTLHEALLEKCRREIEFARQGKPARIIAKINSLLEPQIIQTLYQASMAGVKIDLIVRGICALRPGIPGISANISVHSIVGRFLEHSRVYYFHNDGNAEVYCASADWMDRNFFRRIEVAFPIESRQHRIRIIEDLETYLADNAQAWTLGADGAYRRPCAGDHELINAQADLLRRYADAGD